MSEGDLEAQRCLFALEYPRAVWDKADGCWTNGPHYMYSWIGWLAALRRNPPAVAVDTVIVRRTIFAEGDGDD